MRRQRTLPGTWAIEDVQLLRSLALQGLPVELIASQLGRSASAIKNKAGMHGIPLQSKRQNTRRTG